MLKVAKLSTTELEKSLLVSFEEMNTDSTADKSLSRTAMQSATQSKAPTNKKKKIISSSKPNTSTYVRCSGQKKTVTETQHAEEPVATVDTTQSLEASESAEEVANQPKPTTAKKDLQHPAHGSQTLKVPDLHSASRVTESQNKKNPKVLTFEGTKSSPLVFLGHRTSDPSLYYKFTFSTNHLMLEHETKVNEYVEDPLATNSRIQSLGNVDLDQLMKEQKDDDVEITFMGAMALDQVMDDDDEAGSDRELSVVNEVDANNLINKVVTEINTEDTTKIISDASNTEALGAIRRFKEIQITKAHGSDPLGHLPRRMDILVAQIQNMTKSLLDTFNEKMNSAASTALKLVSDALAQQLPDLLTVTLKHNLPQMITNSMIDTLHGFNWRIRNAIKDEMHAVLKTSVLKSMYKEFNALNKLDTSRFVMLEKRVHQSVHKHVRVKISMIDGPLRQLEAKMDKTSADMTELVGLLSRVVKLIDTSAPHTSATVKGEKESQSQPDNNSNDSIPTFEVPAPAQRQPKSADASDDQTSLALVVHPTAEIHEELPRKRIKVVMEIPTITTLVLLNSIRPTIFDSMHYDQFIANLFGSCLSQYTLINPLKMDDKEKGISQSTNDDALKKIMSFMKEGLSAPSLSSLKYFRIAEEGPMTIKEVDSETACKMYDELIWVIESRHDVVEARKIVEKNLDGLGMD
ncbi:hypothetical protein Tco_1143101 [Tanacetum coccineum]